MALRGNLDDMGTVDLIQFVGQSRKTGALVLTSEGRQARLYYRKGNVVDARLGEDSGLEVVVRVVDWTGGEFEFQPGLEAERPTLDADLPQVITTALKIRDERKIAEEQRRQAEEARRKQEEEQRLAEEMRSKQEAEQQRQQEANIAEPSLDSSGCERLQQCLSGAGFVRYLSVLDANGRPLSEAHASGAVPNGMRELSLKLHGFAKQYPRSDMKRVIVEDEVGTVVLAKMDENRSLMVVAERAPSLGVVCMTLGKLLSRLAS